MTWRIPFLGEAPRNKLRRGNLIMGSLGNDLCNQKCHSIVKSLVSSVLIDELTA